MIHVLFVSAFGLLETPESSTLGSGSERPAGPAGSETKCATYPAATSSTR